MTTLRSRFLTVTLLVIATYFGCVPTASAQDLDFKRGDVNGDGQVTYTDLCELVNSYSIGYSPPDCFDAMDVNDDGLLDLSDAILLMTVFGAGSSPNYSLIPAPGPFACGPDPTPDLFDCARYDTCGSASGVINGNFIRGDCDSSLSLELSDAMAILATAFPAVGTPFQPSCLRACDFDDDVAINIADAVGLIAFLFTGGPPPAAPFPTCGLGVLNPSACLDCIDGGC